MRLHPRLFILLYNSERRYPSVLIKNGTIHNGIGSTYPGDIRIAGGCIAEVGNHLEPQANEDVFDARGMDILPGFIQAVSNWGVNGSMTEIRPSANDNDETSAPIMPELDAFYAFNGRAATAQQLSAFGMTACGVAPTENNLFGGVIAAFTVEGVNPYKMVLKRDIGMMASVTNALKQTYGTRPAAPMTRMWIFTTLKEQLRKAAEYKQEADKPADEKLIALKRVVEGELPLFITCDSKLAMERVMEITAPYEKLRLVIVNGYELDGSETELVEKHIPVVVHTAAMPLDEDAMHLDKKGIAALVDKGALVALSGSAGTLAAREDCLWNAMEMMRLCHNSDKVLPLITSNPAKILGIDGVTGSLEAGKRADLVIWTEDPLTSWQARIVRTFIGGEVTYQEGDALKCM